MKTSDRLLERLREIIDLPEDVYLERTRASRGQKAAGTWSWRVMQSGTAYIVGCGAVGSMETMGELLKAEKLFVRTEEHCGDHYVGAA